MPRYRITVDTGGTFSDFVCFEEESGRLAITKVPSTPDDPSRAILSGLAELFASGVRPEEIRFFSHGTTVGTNALLEGKGVTTGLVVTEGFRGVYEVQEQARPYGPPTFDIFYRKPPLLVPPYRTAEVRERLDYRGEVLVPLDERSAREAIRLLKRRGVVSAAVCLLFSFRNPAHEERLRRLFAEEYPECALSLSCEVLPQIREYYRLSTTVINAYIQPILKHYLARLERRLDEEGVRPPQRYIMQSNGGVATFAAAGAKAVSTVLSGPAGGVIAGVGIAAAAGIDHLITFDMGGTSSDVSLVRGGRPAVQTRGEIDGRPIALPMLDIHTVSAGGGTIARVDDLGLLQVGPDSAGAVPGPACYGQGGEDPTITDACVALGYLNPENFLGGRMRLDAEAARRAIAERVARPLGLPVERAAAGILQVIHTKMEEGIKAISSKRGYDLRDFTLIAFGGAGPVHAGRLAADLGMAGLLVPPYPGCTSALGLLLADVKHDHIRSRLARLEGLDLEGTRADFARLAEEAREELAREGFAPGEMRLEYALDLRYAGQGYEVTVPFPEGADPARSLTAEGIAALRAAFDRLHEQLFGHAAPGEPVELVSLRLTAYGAVPPLGLPRHRPAGRPLEAAREGSRPLYFPEIAASDGSAGEGSTGGGWVETPVYARDRLDVGHAINGPAVIEQLDSTTVIFPGQRAVVDPWRNLIVTRADATRADATRAEKEVGR